MMRTRSPFRYFAAAIATLFVACSGPVEIAELSGANGSGGPDAGPSPDSGLNGGETPDSGADASTTGDGGVTADYLLRLPFAPTGGPHRVLAAEAGFLFVVAGPSWAEPLARYSLDAGETYEAVVLGDISATELTGVARASGSVFASSRRGLLVSTDGGSTFAPQPNNLPSDVEWTSIAAVSNTLFATVATTAPGELYRSDDGGQTFTALDIDANIVVARGDLVWAHSTVVPTFSLSTNAGEDFISTSTDGLSPPSGMLERQGRLYAWSRAGVFESSDDGQTFARVSEQAITAAAVIEDRFVAVAGNFATQLLEMSWTSFDFGPFAGPAAPGGNLVDLRVVDGRLLVAHLIDGLWRWEPGDSEFEHISRSTAYPDRIESADGMVYATRSGGSVVYVSDDPGRAWDARAANLFDVAGLGLRFLRARDGALYAGAVGLVHRLLRSTDEGRSWAFFGQPVLQASGLAGEGLNDVLAVDDVLLVGLQGAWTGAPDGHGSQPDSNPSGGGLFRSTDGGSTWNPVHGGLPRRVGSNGITAPPSVSALHRLGNGRLLAELFGTERRIAWSDDDGQSWSLASSPAPLRESPSVDVAVGGDRVFALTTQALFRSEDGGESFQALDSVPPGVMLRRVAADGQLVILVTEDDRVWYSVDRGDSFHWIEGLPGPGLVNGAHVDGNRAYVSIVGFGIVTVEFI